MRELAGVVGGDLARGARPTHDQQAVDARLVAEVRPAVPARQARRLRRGPADQLLEPTELGLELGRDRDALPGLVQHGVDPAPLRAVHANLGEPLPSGMEHGEQRLEHRRLMAVSDERPGARVETDPQIGAKHEAEAGERVVRRVLVAVLDPAEVRVTDAGRSGDPQAGQAGVLAQRAELRTDAAVQRIDPTADGGIEPRRRHWLSTTGAAYLRCASSRARTPSAIRRPPRRAVRPAGSNDDTSGTAGRASAPHVDVQVRTSMVRAGQFALAGRRRDRRARRLAGGPTGRGAGTRRRDEGGARGAIGGADQYRRLREGWLRSHGMGGYTPRNPLPAGATGVGSLGFLPGSQPEPRRRRRDERWAPRHRAPARPRTPGRIAPRPYSLAPCRP